MKLHGSQKFLVQECEKETKEFVLGEPGVVTASPSEEENCA